MLRFFYLLLALSLTQATAQTAAASKTSSQETFDVLVFGSEPEGIMAAVAAAEEGARTLLVSEDARVGGLYVLGELNSLDLRRENLVQRGLFERWWSRVGRSTSFDVKHAETAFMTLLTNAGVELRLGAPEPIPIIRGGKAQGVWLGQEETKAKQLIDASADGALAAAAGVPYSIGFAAIGLEERMADTLVFNLGGVNWNALVKSIEARGPSYARVNENAAWGSFGGYPVAYKAQEEGIRLRGLNLGRQADGTVLVNALLIYGIEPFREASRQEGMARARREAPRIVKYLRALPGLEQATLKGTAEKLYIRDTRHFETRCTLSVDDTLNNVVRPDDVVAGNYPLDVQTLTPDDDGYVYGIPEIYGARLCVTLPRTLDNLWVVGKTAGYDPLAASSARVVPFGMALAEAVGVAAAQAAQEDLPARRYAFDTNAVQRVRARLQARGAYLPEVTSRSPTGPVHHPYFEAYRALRRKGLALGGYQNDPRLDDEMSAMDFLYLLTDIGQRFWANEALSKELTAAFPKLDDALSTGVATDIFLIASCELGTCLDARDVLTGSHSESLTRGDAYALAAELARVGEAGQEAQENAAEE